MSAETFLAIQALALAAAVSLTLHAPKPTGHERTVIGALRDLREGVGYAFRNPIMSPMLISAAYVGVFVVGSLQVLFPLIIRDAYGGDATTQASRLAALFASFWAASFVSAVFLSRMKPLAAGPRDDRLAPDRRARAHELRYRQAILGIHARRHGVGIGGGRRHLDEPHHRARRRRAAISRARASVYSMGFMGGAPLGFLRLWVLPPVNSVPAPPPSRRQLVWPSHRLRWRCSPALALHPSASTERRVPRNRNANPSG